MSGALVLNATYEPLCVVPLRRAVVLVLAEKAVIVEAGDEVMHSERTSIPVPTVVRLSHFVRVPYRREVPLTRRAVLDRDSHQCVYCGNRADTIDHVRPRSRGGEHVWTNVVAGVRAATIARVTGCFLRTQLAPRDFSGYSHPRRWLSSWDGPNAIRPGSRTSSWNWAPDGQRIEIAPAV